MDKKVNRVKYEVSTLAAKLAHLELKFQDFAKGDDMDINSESSGAHFPSGKKGRTDGGSVARGASVLAGSRAGGSASGTTHHLLSPRLSRTSGFSGASRDIDTFDDTICGWLKGSPRDLHGDILKDFANSSILQRCCKGAGQG